MRTSKLTLFLKVKNLSAFKGEKKVNILLKFQSLNMFMFNIMTWATVWLTKDKLFQLTDGGLQIWIVQNCSKTLKMCIILNTVNEVHLHVKAAMTESWGMNCGIARRSHNCTQAFSHLEAHLHLHLGLEVFSFYGFSLYTTTMEVQ